MTTGYIDRETHEQPTQNLSQINNIDEMLLVFDNDFMMSSTHRICQDCGSDHSYKPNFERVRLSVDIIPELLQRKNNNNKDKILEVIE
jgi:hypothetical protein